MSTYTELQAKFAFNIGRFLLWIEGQGYNVSFGEAWRTPEQAALNAASGKGIKNSLHCDRMALDLIIRHRDGSEVKRDDYARCGASWKAIDPLNRWGGDFTGQTAGDFQHFSQEFEGRR